MGYEPGPRKKSHDFSRGGRTAAGFLSRTDEFMANLTPSLVRLITSDESLVRGLDEPAIRVLLEWIESECESHRETVGGPSSSDRARHLIQHARGIARFAQMWNNEATRSGAVQLWATQRWGFSLPSGPVRLMDLLQRATSWRPPARPAQAA